MDTFSIKKIPVVRKNTDEHNFETEKILPFSKCLVKF